MNIPQIKKLGKLLKDNGLISSEGEVMVFMIPLPREQFFDLFKFDGYLQNCYWGTEYHKEDTIQSFLTRKFGEDFVNEFCELTGIENKNP